jgi:murein DD-endopeptidase MepM/ murein hydrolase activator NlpD
MSAATTRARTSAVLFLTAVLATGAALPSAASRRLAALDPTTMSVAASAARAAAAEQVKATESRIRAERAMEGNSKFLDQAEYALDTARERLTRLSALVTEAAGHRRGVAAELLDAAAEATQVAANVAGAAGPVIGALEPLRKALDEHQSAQQSIPDADSDEQNLRSARAEAIRDHRAAAYDVARAERAVESATATLATARDKEQQATETAAAATTETERLVASLGIDKRLVRPGAGVVSSAYGMRTHPVTGARKAHTGVDFEYADGLAYAAAEGVVAEVTVDPAYGNLLTIAHGDGIRTRYAHLATTLVEPGEHVSAGQVVGKIGSTGLSTGPHLHFEIQVNGQLRDPAGWIGG